MYSGWQNEYLTNQQLKIDSIYTLNSDTIYNLKTRVDLISWELRLFEPSILGIQIRLTPNQEYFFEGKDTFLLKPLGNLNDNWTFKDSIQATITYVGIDSVLGIVDSIKIIQLSNGDSITIARSLGIVEFPNVGRGHFQTISIEGDSTNFGYRIPKHNDIFNFEVGDVFQYYGFHTGYEREGYRCTTKVVITQKDTLGRGYEYYFNSTNSFYSAWAGGISGVQPYPLEICRSPFNANIVSNLSDTSTYWSYQLADFQLNFNELEQFSLLQEVGGTDEILGFWLDLNKNSERYMFIGPDIYPNDSVFSGDYYYWLEYKKGLGVVFYEENAFEHYYSLEMIGYVKNGDTIGTIYSDTQILAQQKLQVANSLTQAHLFPNPSPSAQATLQFPEVLEAPLRLEVYNLQGQQLYGREYAQASSQIELSVPGLSAGLYIIRLSSGGQEHRMKWVVGAG